VSTVDRISDSLSIVTPGSSEPQARADVDSWSLGRARLVAFKAARLLSAAKRELGAFGEGTLSADFAPDFLRASEHVGEALAVLEELQDRLQGREQDT
jgi:hypothetical protein